MWRTFWTKLLEITRGASGKPATSREVQHLISRGDLWRDRGDWRLAAAAYKLALEHSPSLAAIWVQLGNMSKEAHEWDQAEAAYRRAISLNDRLPDTYLQLGRLFRLRGNAQAAVEAYAKALELDRHSQSVIDELLAMGRGRDAGQAAGYGLHSIQAIGVGLTEVRRILDRIERTLPNILGLASVSSDDFEYFAQRFDLPQAPPHDTKVRWSVLIVDGGDGGLSETVRSIAKQSDRWISVTILTDKSEVELGLEQVSYGGLTCSVTVVSEASDFVCHDNDWVLIVQGGTRIVRGACGWLEWAISEVDDMVALYSDELLADCNAANNERETKHRAYFKSSIDFENGANLYSHSALAVRSDAILRYVGDWKGGRFHFSDLERTLSDAGNVGHLPRILFQRPTRDLAAPTLRRAMTTSAQIKGLKIGVVIPTRNGGEELENCLKSLRLGDATGNIEVVILDNGSTEELTLGILQRMSLHPCVTVVKDSRPFNWSQLSNLGATSSQAELLLFLNDDVELFSEDWADILRTHLSRSEVGVVGCKLFYPDGEIQHAGMVFGPDGRTAHEGRGQVTIEARWRWDIRRKVGAVTGAFLACRRSVFDDVGRFDEAHFPIWFNDVDFCLKVRSKGFSIIYEPAIVGLHHESKTLKRMPETGQRREFWDLAVDSMRTRWGSFLTMDPGFNPHYSRSGYPLESISEPSLQSIRSHLALSAQVNPWLTVESGRSVKDRHRGQKRSLENWL